MTSVNLSSQSLAAATTSASYATTSVSASASDTATAASATASPSTQVTISGEAMMLSRLFNTDDPNANPVIHYSSEPILQGVSTYSYLNASDRTFVSKLYEYAQQNGIDPLNVDYFAFDVGVYRSTEHILAHAPYDYDKQGNPVVRTFNVNDEAIAQNIYTSKALNDTEVNHGFLKFMLDPGWHPVHATDFKFLQEVVFGFSASGEAADPNAKPVVRPKASDFAPYKLDTSDSGGADGAFLFEKYASRVKKLSNWLTDDDKSMLGLMYSLAEPKGEGAMKKVDRYAAQLVIAHLTEQLVAGIAADPKKEKAEAAAYVNKLLLAKSAANKADKPA